MAIKKTLTGIVLAGALALGISGCGKDAENGYGKDAEKNTQNPSTEYSFADTGVKGEGLIHTTIGQSLPIASGDFDGDGLNDIVIVDNTGSIHIHKNLGDGRFRDSGVVGTIEHYIGSGQVGSGQLPYLTVNDFNNDGKPDIATVDRNGFVKVYENRTE
ncbi:VCBS repeat-containing protein [Candidatus Pacearchaeota archaeon]|nr:VCBS repeat-containing protein [Candidatus Pacearchaeota archaeon]